MRKQTRRVAHALENARAYTRILPRLWQYVCASFQVVFSEPSKRVPADVKIS